MMLPEGIEEMVSGPGRLRFVVQPIVAILLGIRDGRRDAADGRPAYFFSILTGSQPRRDATAEGLAVLARPLAVAILIDMVLQYFIFSSVRIWHAVVVGAVLIALPYVTARGFSNRLRKHRAHRK